MVEVQSLASWPWLKGWLRAIGEKVAARMFLHELVVEVLKDSEIWDKQAYQLAPKLSSADRDILPFRRYCEQFYPFQPTDSKAKHRPF